jgi:hypothetical protein
MSKEFCAKTPVLHGNYEVTHNRHRGVGVNPNAVIAKGRGALGSLFMEDGFPMSRKGRRLARQPGGRGKYGQSL